MIDNARSRGWTVLLVRMLLLLCMAVAVASQPAQAQPATPVAGDVADLEVASETTVNFPVGIDIVSDIAWDDQYDRAAVELLYTVAGDQTATLIFVPTGTVSDVGEMQVSASLDLQAQFVPSGVVIDFWWRIVDDGVTIAESALERTHWFDTRWDWQVSQTDQVRVHSYDYDQGFIEEILDSAQATVTELEQRYSLERSAPLDIWIYPSLEDFQGAQQPNSRESIAGASYPGYFLILAVVPDGSTGEVGRVVLHEVSHQVLYQATANPFTYPPLWFDEGLATHFQVGGTDGYMEMVVRADQDDALFDIASLNASFPYQPAQATLAYATSWSVIEYIEVTYGDEGISALITAFATGVPYDEAITEALGVDGEGLNNEWKAWVASQEIQ
ncbi:MAG: peptidase MA family metallohydrolase [Thermomicrobiales bacterium]